MLGEPFNYKSQYDHGTASYQSYLRRFNLEVECRGAADTVRVDENVNIAFLKTLIAVKFEVSASKIKLSLKADNLMTLGQAGIFDKSVIVAG